MKVSFSSRSVGPLWWDRVEGPEEVEERSAERQRPRSRVDSVGDGMANPGEGSKSLLDVGQRLGRTDGNARVLESFEKVALVPWAGKLALAQTATKLSAGVDMVLELTMQTGCKRVEP